MSTIELFALRATPAGHPNPPTVARVAGAWYLVNGTGNALRRLPDQDEARLLPIPARRAEIFHRATLDFVRRNCTGDGA